ncbi:hypothetical protein, partial [Haematobacter sp.]|uniref:hypothetical protein n=2 Tax=unclassified Haematobacter TaxID=2640585 RepID=UPI0028B06ECF
AHNPGDLPSDRANVICEESDVVILANIEASLARLISAEHNAALLICDGCGDTRSNEDLAAMRGENPNLISCCPERKMRLATRSDWDGLRARIKVLEEALVGCMTWMEQLRASGDAGFWSWSEGDEYTRARAALSLAQGGIDG